MYSWMMSSAEVKRIKEMYPEGTRIRLVYCNDRYTRLKYGDLGTVRVVDDCGTVHVNWDCGSRLGLVLGEDSFEVIKKQEGVNGNE